MEKEDRSTLAQCIRIIFGYGDIPGSVCKIPVEGWCELQSMYTLWQPIKTISTKLNEADMTAFSLLDNPCAVSKNSLSMSHHHSFTLHNMLSFIVSQSLAIPSRGRRPSYDAENK